MQKIISQKGISQNDVPKGTITNRIQLHCREFGIRKAIVISQNRPFGYGKRKKN